MKTNQQKNPDDRIKITLTIPRYLADEIESAIVKHIGCDNDSDEDDEELVRDLEKVADIFGRAYRNNKRID